MVERSSNLVRNTTIYAIGDIFPKIISLITFPILTTYLVPAEYGILNYVNTIETFLSAIGLLSINTYYLVYYFKVGNEEEQKKLLGNLSLFIIGFNVVFSLLLYIVGPVLFRSWGSEVDFYPYIAIGVITNFCGIVKTLPAALYRVQERPLPLTIFNIVGGVLTMVLTLVFVIYIKADAERVLWARFIVSAIFAIVFLVITYRNSIFKFNKKQIIEALRFSLPLVPGTIAFYLYSIFDRILIEKELTLTDLGIYSTASSLALLLNIISNGAYKAFEPYFFKKYGHEGFVGSFQKVRDILLFVVLVGGIGLSLFAKEFFIIFASEKYDTAYQYVPIIVLGAIASAIGQMYTTILTAQGKTKINALITIVGSVISIALNSVLLHLIGIWAAAFVFLFTLTFTLVVSKILTHIKVASIKPWVCTIVCFIIVIPISYFISIDNIFVSIGLKSIVFIVLVLLIIVTLKVDIKLLLSLLIRK